MHSLTFAPGPFQKNHFPASFKTIRSIYACKLVEFAPSSPQTTQISLISHNCQSVSTNKKISKMNILWKFFSESYHILYAYVYQQ